MGSITNRIEASSDYGGRLSALVGDLPAGYFDTYIYTICDRMTKDYQGGVWDLVEFKTNPDEDDSEFTGFYLQLDSSKTFDLEIASNLFKGTVSADALSIIANIVAFNTLTWQFHNEGNQETAEIFNQFYHSLRYFGAEHAESSLILGAID
jgi:hypothetical protein